MGEEHGNVMNEGKCIAPSNDTFISGNVVQFTGLHPGASSARHPHLSPHKYQSQGCHIPSYLPRYYHVWVLDVLGSLECATAARLGVT